MAAPARILVVDDSPTILKVVAAILSRHGYAPVVAHDGIEGMAVLESSEPIALVLLDFVMPRMNGYQFCRALRSSRAHRSLPVVLMSAKGDKIRGQFVKQTGAIDAITKPFDPRALVAVVEGALARSSEGRAREIPEGETMPDEETIYESVRPGPPSSFVRHRATLEFADHVADAVTPAILALSPQDRGREASLRAAIGSAMSGEIVPTLAASLRGLDHGAGVKEVLSGDLSVISLAEVLQILQMQRHDGVLRVSNTKQTATISIRQGLVDLAQAPGAADELHLGRYFIEQGLISRAQLDEALESQHGKSKLLGELLVEGGLATAQDLTAALSRQSSEIIYEVLRWPTGTFALTHEPYSREAATAQLALPISGLVLEGFRRVDEWRLMESTIDFDGVLVLDALAAGRVGAALTRPEKLILDTIDGQRTVSEVIRESAVGSFDAIKTIYQFLQSRVLRTK